jgi:hypothetical protein
MNAGAVNQVGHGDGVCASANGSTHGLRDPEVEHLHEVPSSRRTAQEQVRGLDGAVHEPAFGLRQRMAHLAEDVDDTFAGIGPKR